MSLAPSYQIYQISFLDSFQSSLSRINGCHKHFLRYGSSIPFKRYNFYITQKALNERLASEQNPQRKSSFVVKSKDDRSSFAGETPISQSSSNGGFSSRDWIDKWGETPKRIVMNRPKVVLDYQNDGGGGGSDEDDEMGTSLSTGSSTMEKIVNKLKRFGYVDEVGEEKERLPERGSVEDIFYVEEGLLPNPRGGFSLDTPLGIEDSLGGKGEVKFPWEKSVAKVEEGSVRIRSRTSLAELTLPESELRRLRNLAVRTKSKTKIGGAGVTQAIVDVIHEKWKTSEIVRLKCEGPPALNMKRMHEILERKTGGLVIWRSGSSISLYRGVGYKLPSYEHQEKHIQNFNKIDRNSSATAANRNSRHPIERGPDGVLQVDNVNSGMNAREPRKVRDAESLPEIKYEHEIDKLLDDLGPRYTDWPGSDPLPVDADMLPAVIPGYKPPFRILPYGVRSTLGGYEATALRRLSRALPPHFAIGRSRQHHGLAMAIIKLWESSSIAKIALKRGVQLTTSERMAEDIKKLTGGTLLTRNKDYFVFYRGKDFLSPEVTEALLERERLAKTLQDEEEQARLRGSSLFSPSFEITEESGTAGTLGESLEADARWGKRLNDKEKDKAKRAAELQRHASLVRKLEHKLFLAERKLSKAERDLAKVEVFLKPAEPPKDPETISDEERFMFRKVGLKMSAFLLLGRRGVFDGTVENMHLHWKYRELVKIIVKAPSFDEVRNIALALEAESGGVLVSVDKVSKGFAIIVFRGREYQRPALLRPKNLLTKRKALARSIELQRREALHNHVATVHRRVEKIKAELDKMEAIREQGNEELYAELDSAYSTEEEDNDEDEGDETYLETYASGEEEDNKDEGDEAYLETYASGEEEEEGDSDDESIHNNRHSETNFPYDQVQEWESDSKASRP